MKLWKNAKFYTMNKENEFIDQIITNNGLIYLLGDECENIKVDEVIDLNGGFVFPGFIDAHMHLIGYGRKLLAHNIEGLNFKQTLQYIENTLESNKSLYEGYFNLGITKNELDKISDNTFIMLRHNDYHSFTVNSKVLDFVNLKHNTGILTNEEDTKLVLSIWNTYNKSELTNMTTTAIKSLYENGITNVFSDDLSYFNSYDETNEILLEAIKEHPIRVNELIHYEVYDDYLKNFKQSNFLKPIQVKTFYDGTLSSKTALLKSNYKNTNSNGVRSLTKTDFTKLVKKVRFNNDSIAVHVIGDLALEEVVDVLEEFPATNLPDRIIHASLTNIETIKRLKRLNVVLDIQPLFKISDKEVISKNINHHPLVYPFKTMNENSLLLNSSSDAPVENINPLETLQVLNDLSRYESIKTYTLNPGLSINENVGMIKKNYKADLTVFNNDIMDIVNNILTKTKVIYTIIDEQIVYENVEGIKNE